MGDTPMTASCRRGYLIPNEADIVRAGRGRLCIDPCSTDVRLALGFRKGPWQARQDRSGVAEAAPRATAARHRNASASCRRIGVGS